MKILFLDDSKARHQRFKMNRIGMDITAVWTYAEACDHLAKTIFDTVYLDHDLSDKAAAGRPGKYEKTGTHVAEFIATLPEDRQPKFVIIHSMNPVGSVRMFTILQEAGVRCRIIPFEG